MTFLTQFDKQVATNIVDQSNISLLRLYQADRDVDILRCFQSIQLCSLKNQAGQQCLSHSLANRVLSLFEAYSPAEAYWPGHKTRTFCQELCHNEQTNVRRSIGPIKHCQLTCIHLMKAQV